MNHLLIDFENVQPNNLDKLDDENTHIWLFLGANQQKSISLELCQSLCRFGKNVHFIRIKKTGKNALDFYLSFYLGKITEQDPAALIGILSKDGGYDVWWCPKKYADIKRQANNDISIVQNFLLKQRNLANLNY